jgi:hypothetical protein
MDGIATARRLVHELGGGLEHELGRAIAGDLVHELGGGLVHELGGAVARGGLGSNAGGFGDS